MRPLAANGKRTVREKTISSRFDDSGGARCARVGSELASVVDVLLASRQNESPEVVQPWQRECRPSRGLLGICSSPSGKVRTSPFTAADSTATHRQSWRSHSLQNRDRKSTRLNSSHGYISYAVFCLKKKKKQNDPKYPTKQIKQYKKKRT